MIELAWHNMNDKTKAQLRSVRPLTFIPSPLSMSAKRIREIIEEYSSKSILLFGASMEEWLPNMENFEQFRPLYADDIKQAASKMENTKNLAILKHHFPFIKYVIRELKPTNILWVNGSQRNILHSYAHFWEGVNVEAKMDHISRFSSEKEAQNYAKKVCDKNEVKNKAALKSLKAKSKITPEDIMEFCHAVSKGSWDWTGLHSAVIAKGDKVLAYSHNHVLPYESAIMHEGCRRERILSPRGEDQDLGETNHAETSCIVKVASSKESLVGTDLYTMAFPCPTCARVIADSPIEKIFYTDEYTNEIGYRILKRMGKKIIKM